MASLVTGALLFGTAFAALRRPVPSEIRGAIVGLYEHGRPQPVGVLKVGRLFAGQQRRGFLRIGFLPMAVAEEVQLELRDRADLGIALQQSERWWQQQLKHIPFEVRHLTITWSGPHAGGLRAGLAEGNSHGIWLLSAGVENWEGGSRDTSARGRIEFQNISKTPTLALDHDIVRHAAVVKKSGSRDPYER